MTYTPLPPKWTPSSIFKLHDELLSKYLKNILNSNVWTTEEKNERIDAFVAWIKHIHNYTVSGQMTYKKGEADNNKK